MRGLGDAIDFEPATGSSGAGPLSTRLDQATGWFGPVASVTTVQTAGWLPPEISVVSAISGNVFSCDTASPARFVSGSGRALGDPALARLIAIVECIERYSSVSFDEDSCTVASVAELGGEGADLSQKATFSDVEIRESHGRLARIDIQEPLRWDEGMDVLAGRRTLVPSVMAHLIRGQWANERFHLSFSTGCAAHSTRTAALTSGILEIIEREACAVAWLHALPLDEIRPDSLGDDVAAVCDWFDERDIETRFYNATTDFGVPVVLCLQLSEDEYLGQRMSAASDFTFSGAAMKALLECGSSRAGIRTHAQRLALGEVRTDDDAPELADGAATVALRRNRAAFDFLMARRQTAARPSNPSVGDGDSARLRFLTDQVERLGLHLFDVDLSTVEARALGLHVHRAVIPEALPLSVRAKAQYRGTERLWSLPSKLGHVSRQEARLNPYPMPIA